jgi:hypothetical protein
MYDDTFGKTRSPNVIVTYPSTAPGRTRGMLEDNVFVDFNLLHVLTNSKQF